MRGRDIGRLKKCSQYNHKKDSVDINVYQTGTPGPFYFPYSDNRSLCPHSEAQNVP